MSDLEKETVAGEVTTESENQTADDVTLQAATFGIYAMVNDSSNSVQDVLECLDTFKMDEYYFVKIDKQTQCEKGMIYDAEKKTFTAPPVEEVTASHEGATIIDATE